MRNGTLKTALPLLLLIAGATSARAEGSEADYRAAYAAAEAANKQAGALRNQWTTTAATLAAAKKSADAGERSGADPNRAARSTAIIVSKGGTAVDGNPAIHSQAGGHEPQKAAAVGRRTISKKAAAAAG